MTSLLAGPSTLAAILTPLGESGEIDPRKLARHAKWIIKEGCDGIALFGTTGEASSFSAAERRQALDSILAEGVPPERIVVGTGCTALADAVEIGRHAVGNGCAGLLVVPPYFFKPVAEEGLLAFYAGLIETIDDRRLRICLYHFPGLSGVPLSPDFVARLHSRFPGTVVALKDSSGDFDNMLALHAAVPALSVFTGDDHLLGLLLRAGGAGSITAGGNLWPAALAKLRDAHALTDAGSEDAQRLADALWRDCLLELPVTEALKQILADATGDAAWLGMRPPLVPLDAAQHARLREGLRLSGFAVPDSLHSALRD